MITIGKVRNAEYYLNELHHDDAYEYYGSLERSGRWHGTFAAQLDLTGEVDPDDFRAILEGVRPDTGTSLTAFPIKVTALDVTLSVPKSMSVLWAVGDHDTRRNVESAVDAAEAAVVRLLEAEATIVRRGHGGLDYHDGNGAHRRQLRPPHQPPRRPQPPPPPRRGQRQPRTRRPHHRHRHPPALRHPLHRRSRLPIGPPARAGPIPRNALRRHRPPRRR